MSCCRASYNTRHDNSIFLAKRLSLLGRREFADTHLSAISRSADLDRIESPDRRANLLLPRRNDCGDRRVTVNLVNVAGASPAVWFFRTAQLAI